MSDIKCLRDWIFFCEFDFYFYVAKHSWNHIKLYFDEYVRILENY